MELQKFNKVFADPNAKTLIRKALTSATGVGEALVPEHLEDIITNLAVRLVPELGIVTPKYDPQKFHEFNRLSSIPAAGSAMGENSVTPTRAAAYQRANVEMKIMKRKGAVTGFLQDASANYTDAQAAEMENHVQSFGNDMRTYIVFGNKGADTYSFDGLDKFIATKRDNLLIAAAVQTNLSLMDTMIDNNHRKQGAAHRKIFLMTPELNSQLSRLWTNVRDNRDAHREGTNVIEVSGGYKLESYRNVPIVETTALGAVSKMGTVGIAAAGAGSGITDDQYFFRVSAVTWDGEQEASDEVNVNTTSNDTITLSFTAVENALYYKVYEGLTTGQTNTKLIRVVSAFTYDGNGTITAAITSIVLTDDAGLAVHTASVPTHMTSDIPLITTAGGAKQECMILWDLDEFQGMGKLAYTNSAGERFRGLITTKPLAETDDNTPFLLKSYAALVDSFEATSYMVRGIAVK